MRKPPLIKLFIAILFSTSFLFTACVLHEKPGSVKTGQVEANIKMYTHVWDEIRTRK